MDASSHLTEKLRGLLDMQPEVRAMCTGTVLDSCSEHFSRSPDLRSDLNEAAELHKTAGWRARCSSASSKSRPPKHAWHRTVPLAFWLFQRKLYGTETAALLESVLIGDGVADMDCSVTCRPS